jgi:hypothetical protein
LNFARTQVSDIEPILAHAGLLYDVRDHLHFEDTPLARSSEALHKISSMEGNDPQKAPNSMASHPAGSESDQGWSCRARNARVA